MADEINQAASHMLREYDYIFYVSPEGVELEDNGVRAVDAAYRIRIDKEIQQLLTQYKSKITNYIELSGSTEERILKVKQVMGF